MKFLGSELENATTAAGALGLLADWFVPVNERMAPTYKVLVDSAAVDPTTNAWRQARNSQRFERYLRVPDLLCQREGILHDQDDEAIAAVVWDTGHPQTYIFGSQYQLDDR